MENQFLNFCVGDYVGGQLRAKLLQNSKDALEHFASFDTEMVTESDRGNMVSPEKSQTYKKLYLSLFPEFNLKIG